MIDYTAVNDPNVIDKQAYVLWKRCHTHKYLNEEKLQDSSDGGKVNLGWVTNQFNKKIEHLPQEEQNELQRKKKIYNTMMLKGNGYKMKAYGNALNRKKTVGDDGRARTILWTKKEEIIELFGKMFTPEEIHRIAVEQFKIPCALSAVYNFREKYIDQITEKLNEFRREYSDIRLGVKRGRLEELVWMFMTMKDEYKKNRSVIQHRALITNLEQIRKEVEGDTLKLEGNIGLNIEMNINNHLQYEVFKQININQIIVGRVASKLHVFPELVIKSLMDSYYHNLTGIVEPVEDADYEQLNYPSMIPYDFNAIQEKNRLLEEGMKEKKEEVKIVLKEETEKSTELGLKEKLLQLVQDSKELLDEKANAINGIISNTNKNKGKK